MKETIRLATSADADRLAAIYSRYVEQTAISLEMKPPGVEEFTERIASIGAFHPYLVHLENDSITGFAYASKFHEREGYRYDVSVSVYLDLNFQGKGIGKKLYEKLFAIIEEQGFKNAYALITYPNEKSVRLHTGCGFEKLGLLPHCGYKHGDWVDVLYMGKTFGDMPEKPGTIRGIGELPAGFVERVLAG